MFGHALPSPATERSLMCLRQAHCSYCFLPLCQRSVFVTAMQDVGMGDMSGPYVASRILRDLTSEAFTPHCGTPSSGFSASVSIEMVLGLGLALLLNKTFAFRGVARAVILAPYLVPTVLAVLTWRYMFHDIVGIIAGSSRLG